MATVTGLTSARMLEIEAASVVNGYIDTAGHLILITQGGQERDAGPISLFVATETAIGSVELATPSETLTGTDTSRAITPAGLTASLDAKITALPGYRSMGNTIYTSSGSFNKASFPGLKAVRVRVVGAGGGGAGAAAASTGNHSSAGGGGAGGYAEQLILEADLLASETVTVGAGGTSNAGAAGNTGGTTSFGSHVVATGGLGGESVADTALMVTAKGGAGGTGTVGNLIKLRGGPGGFGTGYATLGNGGFGGSSVLGGGGVGVSTPAGSGSLGGTNGGNFGGGGGGGMTNANGVANFGGTGAPGIVIVEVYV